MLRALAFTMYCLCFVLVVGAVWVSAFSRSVDELEKRGTSDLALAADRLVGALFSYRQIAVTLAGDPRLAAKQTSYPELEAILLRAADFSGALDFVLLDPGRIVVASATDADIAGWRSEGFVERAFQGTTGRHLAFSAPFDRRAFLIATPIFSDDGPVRRVLVAVVDLERIEADFRGSNPALFMADDRGVIFFSNRSELVGRVFDRSGLSHRADAGGFAAFTPRAYRDHEIWTVSAGRYLPRQSIHVAQELPVIGMSADALVDLRPAVVTASTQASIVGFALLLFCAAYIAVANQRRTLKRSNEILESRVAERTAALSATNTQLRSEVAERIETELALKRAQADLIQAGKLSALGKMSAGISHELNQPLMAVQSFADNAVSFLERGDSHKAAQNLARVGELTRRMGRIIKNFRAFAAQEKETLHRVDLLQSVRAAVDLAQPQLERAGVALELDLPDGPLWVPGGEVRLQQVALNLITNAADAMIDAADPKVRLAVTGGDPVCLIVKDNGPGLADPEKVFEPFYTTKSTGDGMGLGLSISYGLVQSFGGKIRGRNSADGGAIFEVELQPWQAKPAFQRETAE